MAVLSNNGRLIVTLPVASTLEDTDQLIIQSVSNVNPNGVTKRASYGFMRNDLSSLVLADIQDTNTLKLTGSFYSLNGGIANFYTTKVRNGLTVTNGGIAVSSGASSFQSVSATQFNGPLTGNVKAVTVNATGTSNFDTIQVTNTIVGNINSSGLSIFSNLQMAGGIIGGLPGAITINNSPIGNSAPAYLRGTTVTASLGFQSLGNASITGNLKVSGTTFSSIISGSRITGSKGITGSLKGNLTGDIFSPTGVKILENGTGLAKRALFYGSSSYAFTSSRAITASYALKTIVTNTTTFALSSSYASSSFKSTFALSSSYASSSKFSVSSSYASSSKFSVSSSYASSSVSSSYTFKTKFSISSSYASSSFKSRLSTSSSYASSSKTSLTSSYILQGVNTTNSIPFYNGTALKGDSPLNYYILPSTVILKLSGSYENSVSNENTNFTIECLSEEFGSYSSNLILSSYLNRSNRSLNFPGDYLAGGGPEGWLLRTFDSGSFGLQSWWESYNFNNPNYVTKLNDAAAASSTFNFAKIINNDIYFWGEPYSFNSSMRDGAIGIGIVQPSNQTIARTTKARLHINVFSSSVSNLGKGAWTGDGTVRNLPAILVTYGSGSTASPVNKTFYVSGSGNTYIGGILSSSQDVYIGGECNIKGNLTSSLDVYIGGDCNIKGNVTSSQDFRIDGDLTVIGSINSGGTGDGSVFHFLSTPVLLDNISNAETNAWITYGGPATGLFYSTYTTARAAVLYVEHTMGIIAGSAGEAYFQFRRNNTETAFKSNRLYTGAGYTSNYGTGNQVIVPLDYNNRSFDYYLYTNSTGNDSGNVTLVGYLT